MNFSTPLTKGTLLKRYKRFLADVKLEDGAGGRSRSTVVTAHCPNTGSMTSCGSPGDTVYILHAPSPKRKLDYTWELTEVPRGYIGINTMRPNALVAEALADGRLSAFAGYDTVQREVKVADGTRIDFKLSSADGQHPDAYIEVKNVTLKEGDELMFPDAKTVRGTKHLSHLASLAQKGHKAVILYVINRPELLPFRIAAHIDPDYHKAFHEALAAGVTPAAYRVDACLTGLSLSSTPVALDHLLPPAGRRGSAQPLAFNP